MNWGFILLCIVLHGAYKGIRPDCSNWFQAVILSILSTAVLGVIVFIVLTLIAKLCGY